MRNVIFFYQTCCAELCPIYNFAMFVLVVVFFSFLYFCQCCLYVLFKTEIKIKGIF